MLVLKSTHVSMCVKYADVFRAAVKWSWSDTQQDFPLPGAAAWAWAKTGSYFRSQAPGWSLRAQGWCLGWFLFRGGQLRSSSSAKSLMFPQSESERRTRVSFGSEIAFWILRLMKSSVFVSLLHPRRHSDSRIMIIMLRSPCFAPAPKWSPALSLSFLPEMELPLSSPVSGNDYICQFNTSNMNI